MKRAILAGLGLATAALTACNGPDSSADAARARDLQLAMQANRMPMQVSPLEMGQPMPGYGPQYGQPYYPQGYYGQPGYPQAGYPQQPVYYPQPQPVYAPAPQPVYRTASATRSAGTATRTAPAPRRVTHVKRDAMIGAGVGAVTGAVIDRSVKGAVIGAAAGGAVGAVVGATIDVDHR